MRILGSLIVLLSLGTSVARAADAEASGVRWEAGARTWFVTLNPILDNYYDEHESVNGFIVGGTATRRAADGNSRIIIGLDYTSTDPDDGAWLEAGDPEEEAEWTEFRDFSIVDANVMYGHVFRSGPFGFFLGGGLGLAVVNGTVTSFPVDANGRKLAGGEPDEKNIPKITPTVILRAGPQFELGKIGTVSLDVGFHHGLYAGASASFSIPGM